MKCFLILFFLIIHFQREKSKFLHPRCSYIIYLNIISLSLWNNVKQIFSKYNSIIASENNFFLQLLDTKNIKIRIEICILIFICQSEHFCVLNIYLICPQFLFPMYTLKNQLITLCMYIFYFFLLLLGLFF